MSDYVVMRKVVNLVCAVAAMCAAALVAWPADTPLSDLKAAFAAIDAKTYPAAIRKLEGLEKRIPNLADYVAWARATAHNESKNFDDAIAAAGVVIQHTPSSPFAAQAALLAGRAHIELGQPQQALAILREHYASLPQPLGDLAMADALAASNDSIAAAVYYQRVYYGFPSTQAAGLADAALGKLQATLGEKYPPAMPHAMLGRASTLLVSGKPAEARKEFEALIPRLGGAERDLARVRIGVAQYSANQSTAAYQYLSALEVASPEADAERLNYLSQAARRIERFAEMDALAKRAAEKYPNSPSTIEALIAAANRHLIENEVSEFEPLYRACFEGLPGDPRTDLCHWKITWVKYMRRDAGVADMLREHLKLYPGSDQSSAALYFLGRLSEQSGDRSAARAFYDEAVNEYPNQFYASQARERRGKLGSAQPSESVREFLRSIQFPERARWNDFQVSTAVKARTERAQLLATAGLKDFAERELRHGADRGEQPHVLAMHLADLLASEEPAQGLRYIKRYARGYLFMPLQSAPPKFWELAFPLPFRSDLERYTRLYNVDPFMMAALIRQESEFDPRAVSVAGARGLTQIKPSTARDIGKKLNVTFSTAKLFQPAYNLQFGAYYFRWMVDQAAGRPEVALAAYNAGLTRAKTWIKWADFREPAEFVETVPLTETRGYIQAVMRNAAAYREIYGSKQVAGDLRKSEGQ